MLALAETDPAALLLAASLAAWLVLTESETDVLWLALCSLLVLADSLAALLALAESEIDVLRLVLADALAALSLALVLTDALLADSLRLSDFI